MTLAFMLLSSIVWGGALCAACLLLQRHIDASGQVRQWIWRGAAALLIAPWIAAPLVSWLGLGLAPAAMPEMAALPETTAAMGEVLVVQAAAGVPVAAEAPAQMLIEWEQVLFLLLAGGWIIRFVAAQLAARGLGGIVATSIPAEPGMASDAVVAWARRLKLSRTPRLRIVESGVSPFSFGVFRPVVCLPHDLERELDPQSLNLVVGHECLHVARGDGWLRPIERLIADIFWFNPFAWRIRRELDMARELAVDEAVVEVTSARKAYARTLRDVAGIAAGLSYSAPAASMSLSGGGRSLMLRVNRTLANARRRPARSLVIAVLGLVGAPVAIAQVVLATPAPPEPPPAPEAPLELAFADPQEVPPTPPVPSVAPPPVTAPTPPMPPGQAGEPVPAPPAILAVPAVPAIPGRAAPPAIAVMPLDGSARAFTPRSGQFSAVFGDVSPTTAKAMFPARVKEIRDGVDGTRTVSLVQTADDGGTKGCTSDVQLLTEVKVEAGQTLSKDQEIGVAKNGAYVSLSCDAIEIGKRSYAGDAAKNLNLWFYGKSDVKNIMLAAPALRVAPQPGQNFAFGNGQGFAFSNGQAMDPELAEKMQRALPRFTPAAPAATALMRAPTELRVTSVVEENGGYTVKLQSTGKDRENRNCKMSVFGMTETTVKKGDIIAKGEPVGTRRRASLRVSDCVIESSGPGALSPISFEIEDQQPVVTPQPQVAPLAPPPNAAPGAGLLRIKAPAAIVKGDARIMNGFGFFTDPFTSKTVWHDGVDIAQQKGSTIYTPGDGAVSFAGVKGSYGRVVEVQLETGALLRFGHLDKIDVEVGDKLKAGDHIGTMGSTGRSTGPHLHLEVISNGKSYDPTQVDGLTLMAAN